jgi:hypothetical protein
MTTTETLCAMIRERAAVGLKKYGVTVDRKDLTADQWLQHSIEEKLDDLQYMMRLRAEIRNMERELAEWKRCAAMFHESMNPKQGPSGEAIIDQQRDAEELFTKLKETDNERNNQNRKP